MSAISTLSDNEVTPHVADVFATAKAAMGKAPTLYRVLAHAPAALDVYTGSKGFLRDGVLSAVAQEQIAIAAANGCVYCLAAHTGGARAAGVSAEDRANARKGRTSVPKIQAILELALAINATHGQGAAAALEAARAYGLTDADILEMIAHVAVNILTNSVNNTVGTVLDFPKVERVA
ncbi:carboxymuconolactone decarboxylase family protein [Ochrobactrum soli]|uniref:Alkylhydroperoxidase n=1 Tax=Ochrobactrum soli TaxID=2448455 RepID=A0A849KT02_9HYPH|nr:carboxymuconolactone decarboxylase family protein [[Ochrobactrum] soli]NNU63473.1 alkylhydroperoxidase [[Ochrobactrum] soli]